MILVFTGDGKGKTTSALGTAMRSLGYDKKVAIIQFIKGPWISGEEKFFEKINLAKKDLFFQKSGKGFVKILGDNLDFKEHKLAAQNGLKIANDIIQKNKYDLIILEEINVAMDLKLISAKDILTILKNFPKDKDIILTGRNAPKSIINKADLATEMKEIKHPFQKSKSAKKGIDY